MQRPGPAAPRGLLEGGGGRVRSSQTPGEDRPSAGDEGWGWGSGRRLCIRRGGVSASGGPCVQRGGGPCILRGIYASPEGSRVRGDPRGAGRGCGVPRASTGAQCWGAGCRRGGAGVRVPGRQGGSEGRAWPAPHSRALCSAASSRADRPRTPACILRAARPPPALPPLPLWPTRDWEVSGRRPHCRLRLCWALRLNVFSRVSLGFFPG